MKTLILLPVLFASITVHASDFTVDGQFRIRQRYENPKDKESVQRTQARLELNGHYNFDEEGCKSAHLQVATGDGFSGTWDDTGLSDKEEDIDLSPRFGYLQFCAGEKGKFQIGTVSVMSDELLGPKRQGPIDYAARYIHTDKENGLEVAVTVGELTADEFKTPSMFDRSHDEINYAQIHINKEFGDINAFTDITHHDDNLYWRGALEFAMSKYIKAMKSVTIEEATLNGKHHGYIVDATIQRGPWKIKPGFSDIEEFDGKEGTQQIPVESFFGEGKNVHIMVSRLIGNSKWMFIGRIRDGEAGPRIEGQLRRPIGINKKVR